MPTRRTFLARALAAVAAAAGLSRLAGGAAKAGESAPVAPQPAESRLKFCAEWANISELHAGKWRRAYRVLAFDERGHCVGVSRKMYADVLARRMVEVSPELPEAP